jgi:hypothetical protein
MDQDPAAVPEGIADDDTLREFNKMRREKGKSNIRPVVETPDSRAALTGCRDQANMPRKV